MLLRMSAPYENTVKYMVFYDFHNVPSVKEVMQTHTKTIGKTSENHSENAPKSHKNRPRSVRKRKLNTS